MKNSMFPNLLHVTCLAHGVHRLGYFIRSEVKLWNNFHFLRKKIVIEVRTPEARFQEHHRFALAS